MSYKFDPTKHGYEPITKFPELEYAFPIIEGYYVKVVTYSYYSGLVYWYSIISSHIGRQPDDRFKIFEGTHDFRKPNTYEKQGSSPTVYVGLISNDEFAESLIKHIIGTTRNDSVDSISSDRYSERLGEKMRAEYKEYYNNG